ncbi:MAG: hypothetical protein ACLS3M_04895 [Collinsella sp.]
MYLGQIVEEIDACGLVERPSHPYAQGLIASIPPLEGERVDTLADIPGTVPPHGNTLWMPLCASLRGRTNVAARRSLRWLP